MFNQHFLKKNLIHLSLIFVLLSSIDSLAQELNTKYEFKHLSVEDGLSQGNINVILKDSKGFMWFGTYDGLNKYDGYKFTIFKNDPNDEHSILSNFIKDIVEDELGYLWIASSEGLDKYNRETNEFIHVDYDLSLSDSLSNPGIESLMIDNMGNLWIGTFERGLYIVSNKNDPLRMSSENFRNVVEDTRSLEGNRVYDVFQDDQDRIWLGVMGNSAHIYDPHENEFERIELSDEKKTNYNIWSISEDQHGNVWLGGDGGLSRIGKDLKVVKNYIYGDRQSGGISRGNIKTIYHDSFNQLWVGTQTGLNRYEEETDSFKSLVHDDFDNSTLSNSEVWSIYQDEHDVMWLGTYTGGINVHHPSFSMFGTVRYNPLDPNGLGGPNVAAFYQEESGNMWIGLDHDGLDYYDMKSNTFKHFKSSETNQNTISGNSVMTIKKDSYGYIWFGTYDDGLSRYNPKTGQWKRYYGNPDDPKALDGNIIYSILEDSDKELWVGTILGGLSKYVRETDEFITYRANLEDSTAMSNDYLWTMLEDRKGEIWIGTSHGLNILDKRTGQFRRFLYDPADPKTIGGNTIQTLFKDSKGRIWVGTQGGGVCLFNRENESFECFSEIDGMSNNIVLGMLEDRNGNLWISTFNGLSKLNPITREIKAYYYGLQGSQFNYESCLKLQDGRLVFGGTQGFNAFTPELIQGNQHIPPVVVTDFQIFNKSHQIVINETALNHNSNKIQPINLDHKQSVFSFEFSSLNYISSKQNQYAYILKGFEDQWTYTSSDRRFATYTNLPEGKYTFQVKGSNNDGVWNETGTSVDLVIHPPWYRTLWFKILASVLFVVIVMMTYWLRVRILYRQKGILEEQVKTRTKEVSHQKEELENQAEMLKKFNEDILNKNKQLEDLHRQKDGMIGIVAHDLRSPLNHIKGFTSILSLTGSLTPDQQKHIDQIEKLIERGNLLISDLLYVNGIKQFDISLNSKTFDMVPFLNEFVLTYNQELERKNQTVDIDIAPKSLELKTDEDVLRRIMENIFSNAIKFSESGKTIYLKLYEKDEFAVLSFRDEGPGIDESERPNLFKMFQKLSARPTGGENSTGLGLSIVKALVEKLEGKIEVNSKLGEGTEFIVSIPKKTQDSVLEKTN